MQGQGSKKRLSCHKKLLLLLEPFILPSQIPSRTFHLSDGSLTWGSGDERSQRGWTFRPPEPTRCHARGAKWPPFRETVSHSSGSESHPVKRNPSIHTICYSTSKYTYTYISSKSGFEILRISHGRVFRCLLNCIQKQKRKTKMKHEHRKWKTKNDNDKLWKTLLMLVLFSHQLNITQSSAVATRRASMI